MEILLPFAAGFVLGMIALLTIGMIARRAERNEQAHREPTATEALDRNALEVDRLTLGTRKNTRTMWGD